MPLEKKGRRILSLVKQEVASGEITLCKYYRELKRLHWAASIPWGVHLLLSHSSAALAHSALSMLASVALNTLADIASPQSNWCTLCACLQARPLCSKDIWHSLPDTKAKVLWLNILVSEITALRGPDSFAGKGNESIGCVQLGRVRRSEVFVFVAVFFPSFCWITAKYLNPTIQDTMGQYLKISLRCR